MHQLRLGVDLRAGKEPWSLWSTLLEIDGVMNDNLLLEAKRCWKFDMSILWVKVCPRS